jgi:XTP/dITP diphosphohydrolase
MIHGLSGGNQRDDKMKLVMVTRNKGKLAEIRNLLPPGFETIDLNEIGFTALIPETGNSFSQNALQKALLVHDFCRLDCISDDSGLEVDALGGRPGIHSARFAGAGATDFHNNLKLLQELDGVSNRKARFVCFIALIYKGIQHTFEGYLQGEIATSLEGTNGFGYDPVFIPAGFDKTLAVLGMDVKNQISHRKQALGKLIEFFELHQKDVF